MRPKKNIIGWSPKGSYNITKGSADNLVLYCIKGMSFRTVMVPKHSQDILQVP